LNGSLVLFDADVPDTVTAKIRNKNLFLRLPDPHGLAIERRIVHFIMSRRNDDEFFVKFNQERDAFLDQIANFNISLTLDDIADEKKVGIQDLKNWASANKPQFKQYVTYYCTTIEASDFSEEFLSKINKVNGALGIPVVTA